MNSKTSENVEPSRRVVVDPVTRIEGHLRLELEAADGVIKDACLFLIHRPVGVFY